MADRLVTERLGGIVSAPYAEVRRVGRWSWSVRIIVPPTGGSGPSLPGSLGAEKGVIGSRAYAYRVATRMLRSHMKQQNIRSDVHYVLIPPRPQGIVVTAPDKMAEMTADPRGYFDRAMERAKQDINASPPEPVLPNPGRVEKRWGV